MHMNFNYECTFGWGIGMVVLPWWCIQRNDVMLKQHSLLVTSLSHPNATSVKTSSNKVSPDLSTKFSGETCLQTLNSIHSAKHSMHLRFWPIGKLFSERKLTYFGYMFDSSENAAARNLPKAIGTELPSQPY